MSFINRGGEEGGRNRASVLFCFTRAVQRLKAAYASEVLVHACDVPCANPASRDRRSPLHNQMFIAEEPILVNTFFSIFRPYGMYEAMYQTRAHLRPQGQATHRSLQDPPDPTWLPRTTE